MHTFDLGRQVGVLLLEHRYDCVVLIPQFKRLMRLWGSWFRKLRGCYHLGWVERVGRVLNIGHGDGPPHAFGFVITIAHDDTTLLEQAQLVLREGVLVDLR
jgi:hypothetical protein